MALLNYGPERFLGNIGNEAGFGAISKKMAFLEDPIGLRFSGLHASPWTNMEVDKQEDLEDQRKKNLAFSDAYNSY